MLPKVVEQAWYIGKKKLWLTTEVLQQRQAEDATLANSLVIVKLDLELIATERPFAPNNYLSDPNQHLKSLPKSARRKIVNLPEQLIQLICIISKGLLVCVFWNVKNSAAANQRHEISYLVALTNITKIQKNLSKRNALIR